MVRDDSGAVTYFLFRVKSEKLSLTAQPAALTHAQRTAATRLPQPEGILRVMQV